MAVRMILGAAALAALSAPPARAQAPDAIDRFVRQTLRVADFIRTEADLNADGLPETFIYVRDQAYCGSGGCNLYVLSPAGTGHRIVLRTTVTWPPITLLPTSTNGWRDIGVTVSGGGTRPSHMARLRFENGRYPSNPTTPPARPLGRPAGAVLIGE